MPSSKQPKKQDDDLSYHKLKLNQELHTKAQKVKHNPELTIDTDNELNNSAANSSSDNDQQRNAILSSLNKYSARSSRQHDGSSK